MKGRFDRHENMDAKTRSAILTITSDLGYGEEKFNLGNCLSGFFDGYDYTDEILNDEYYQQLETTDPALHAKIRLICNTVTNYPKRRTTPTKATFRSAWAYIQGSIDELHYCNNMAEMMDGSGEMGGAIWGSFQDDVNEAIQDAEILFSFWPDETVLFAETLAEWSHRHIASGPGKYWEVACQLRDYIKDGLHLKAHNC